MSVPALRVRLAGHYAVYEHEVGAARDRLSMGRRYDVGVCGAWSHDPRVGGWQQANRRGDRGRGEGIDVVGGNEEIIALDVDRDQAV